MTNNSVTILLVDDHTIVRQGLGKLLDEEDGIRVVGEARNGREAVKSVEKLNPQVVILDIAMPLLNGIEATRLIKKTRPDIKVIILSMHSHDRYISELFRLGASGYLMKDATGADIINAIRAVMAGDTFLSPSISRRIIKDYVSIKKTSPHGDRYSSLSNRERELFQMIAEGHSNHEIADILCLSVSTVKSHRTSIMSKLDFANNTQLVQFAIQLGIVDIHVQESSRTG